MKTMLRNLNLALAMTMVLALGACAQMPSSASPSAPLVMCKSRLPMVLAATATTPNTMHPRPAAKTLLRGRDTRYSWFNPGFPQSELHPVVNVTWHDAQALAK